MGKLYQNLGYVVKQNAEEKQQKRNNLAVQFAYMGIKILPLVPGGKRPVAGFAWKEKASSDPKIVSNYQFEYPGCNYGLVTGELFDVVDFDDMQIAHTIPEKYPGYCICKTPHGAHLYIRAMQKKNTVGKGPLGKVDYRGEGGYIVAPLSEVNGRTYELVEDWQQGFIFDEEGKICAKEAPSEIAEWFEKPKPAPIPVHEDYIKNDIPRIASTYYETTINNLCEEIANAPEGQRNHTLNSNGLRAFRIGIGANIPEEDTTSRLQEAARRAGLEENEILATLKSAAAKAAVEGPADPPRTSIDILEGNPKVERLRKIAQQYYTEKSQKVKYELPICADMLNVWGVAFDTFHSEYVLEDGTPFRGPAQKEFYAAALAVGMSIPAGKTYINQPLEFISRKYDGYQKRIAQLPKWDGIRRIEQTFCDYCGAEDTEENRKAALYLWTALAGRALASIEYPCKADIAIVLAGAQGVGKTTFTKLLCLEPIYHGDINLAAGDEEIQRALIGKAVIEIPELAGYRDKDMTYLKALLSRDTIDYRPLYHDTRTRIPLRCVYILTTNESQFLRDPTGERRWRPVSVGTFDLERLVQDRDQLWTEAIETYKTEGVMWRGVARTQELVVPAYKEELPYVSEIRQAIYQNQHTMWYTTKIGTEVLGIEVKDIPRYRTKIGRAMSYLGYRLSNNEVELSNGTIARVYEKQDPPQSGTEMGQDTGI